MHFTFWQVLFCSRTHSQLSQFVGELRRTGFAETVSVAALASRKALCVNPDVAKLVSLSRINEKCLDMQQPSGKAKKQASGAGAGPKPKPKPKVSFCVNSGFVGVTNGKCLEMENTA